MFLHPDSKACAEKYGEGPDAKEEEKTISQIIEEVSEREIRQIKLKPCPLCGTLPYTWAERLDDERMKACIRCNNSDCKATVVRVIETKRGLLNFEEIIGGIEEAANTWNRRV